MGRIADLKKPIRRLMHYDGKWWIVTMSQAGVSMKVYKKRADDAIHRLWREVASPGTLPLFEGASNGEDTNPTPPAPGVEHEAGGDVCGLTMP